MGRLLALIPRAGLELTLEPADEVLGMQDVCLGRAGLERAISVERGQQLAVVLQRLLDLVKSGSINTDGAHERIIGRVQPIASD